MLVLALTPLAAMSILQTHEVVQRADEGRFDSALSQTLEAASAETQTIRDTQKAMETLAGVIGPYVDDPEACRRMVERVAAQIPEAAVVAYTPMSGLMTCSSTGQSYDFSRLPQFQDLISVPAPRMVVNARGPVSGTSVLGIGHPVFGPDGREIGVTSASIPHSALMPDDGAGGPDGLGPPVSLITFDNKGTVLTASTGLVGARSYLPASRPLHQLMTGGFQAFEDRSADGTRRLFASVPIAANLAVLGVWTVTQQGIFASALVPYLYPLLMCMAGLAVAALGVERLVTRHVRSLSRSMQAFSGGGRPVPEPALQHAPSEIAALAETYRRMTDTIVQDEADLENLLRQKEELLREVHHRTGNSLQLIASILRMHLREDPDESVRRVLETVLERVLGLSTVHLGLYRMAGQTDIAMDALIGDVVDKVRPLLERPGRMGRIATDLHPVSLTSQQAVPLALLLAEMLSVSQAGAAEDEAPVIHVGLDSPTPMTVRLTLRGPDGAYGALSGQAVGSTSIIAARLIQGFVDQMDGDLVVRRTGTGTEAVLTFARRHVEGATV